ncbi:MAG: Gfo/Idh/MocA family oxidoreductase [Planctomycetaceae bacterium]|nr:Gfo/Idh/MocA family oxidoreductase [Planctomycetaceae bacterium]
MTRRSFISASTGLAAASALPAVARARYAAPSDQVTVGVMGLSRGMSLCNTFAAQPGVRLKYVCEVDSDRLTAALSSLESLDAPPTGVADFRAILDDPEVDALVCAAPNHWHAPASILACTSGKHAYVEKPCSHNPREGELLVEAARKHKRAVQMGSQRRSAPGFKTAVALLQSGTIGRVYLARTFYNANRTSIGVGKPGDVPATLDYDLWQGPAPRVPYFDNRIPYNWHWFWHWGNGELGNNGVHGLDICRWGLGADYPIRVTSSGGRYHFHDDQQTPDTHTVCFEFDGGRMATWECLSCNRHDGNVAFVTFFGEDGSLELDYSGTFRIYDANDKLVREEASKYTDAIHVENFLTAIREDKPLDLNAEILEGHKSTLLCHLGNIAHRTGRTLSCSATDGHILGDADAMLLWGREYQSGWEPQV